MYSDKLTNQFWLKKIRFEAKVQKKRTMVDKFRY